MRPALLVLLLASAAGGCGEPERVTDPELITLELPFRYPIELWDAAEEGETMLMVHVTDVGGVDSVYVLEPSGYAAFDSAALNGAWELRFAPAREGEDRVAAWVRLPVRFRQPTDSTSIGGAG